MFPSGNNYTMPGISFSGDKHPASSSLDEYDHIHPSSFFHFPTPFSVDHDDDDDGLLMSHFLSQAHQQIMVAPPPDSQINAAPSPIKETKKIPTARKRSTTTGAKQGIPRKRTGKKDRHSKIYTAHGPRDRRMRLSLQIARKFFDLQDMLCFDKASKTIEWLLSKSMYAIKELTENMPAALKHSVSSTSESEVVSAAKSQAVLTRGESLRSTATGRVTKGKKSRKVVFNHHVARESRDKARARARERTREKMKMRGLDFDKTNKCSDECNPNEFLLEIGENSGPAAEEEEKPRHITEQQMDYVGTIENFLGLTRSSSMFNYSNNIAHSAGENSAENCPIISGNWGMNNERFQYSYCSMTNIKDSTGNTQEQNPNSYAKMMNPSNVHEGKNPTSILMSTSDIGLHSDYHENPGVASKIFHNFY